MEAKKVDPRVCNIKVYVDGRSRELQEKLFTMGCRWAIDKCEVQEEYRPFLYVDNDGRIRYGIDMDSFVDSSEKEVKVDEVLAMIPGEDEECTFAPYDRVLGRDKDDQQWQVDIFCQMGESPYKYECFRGCYRYCVSYFGNEHLAGKIK